MFYTGICENNNDPMKLGRVQLRVFGLHTENKNGTDPGGNLLATADLPWALPVMPIKVVFQRSVHFLYLNKVHGLSVVSLMTICKTHFTLELFLELR